MIFRGLLIISTLLLTSLSSDNPDKDLFISPVRIPLLLSANFAEIRADHFHSGIDIRTQGITGHEIVAAASGYVYRVSVSPGGFGKALYIKHASGYSTVYGHLDRFTPEIEEYVSEQQYQNRSFTVSLFPAAGRFVFKQGELIAYSGNTGSSGGPHLHYEIRRSDDEFPLDPLKFNFGVRDNIKPIIENLAVYPLSEAATINGRNQDILLPVQGSHGNYYIRSDRPVTISGKAGFGIRTHDLLNDSWNKCGVYSIELQIDGETLYRFQMDGFSFDETRYVNSHIDYRRKIRDNITVQKAFMAPNDRLSAYKAVKDNGIFKFQGDTTHQIKILVTDSHENVSVLSFNVRSSDAGLTTEPVSSSNSSGSRFLQYNKPYRMADDDITVSIAENSFYDDVNFTYSRREMPETLYSDLYDILDRYTAIHKPYKLSIKPKSIPPGLKEKLAIVSISNDGKASYAGGEWSGEYLVADLRGFGTFSVGIDTIPPTIRTNGFRDGIDLTGRRELKFNISDDFSGIKSYEAYIDDKWVLFEYDPKNTLIAHRFDAKKIEKGKMHSFQLRVTDNRNNITELNGAFKW